MDKNTQRTKRPTEDDMTIIKIVSIRGRSGDGGTTYPVFTATRKIGGHCDTVCVWEFETVGGGEAGDVVETGDEGVVKVRTYEL